ncbi:hypothetical protein [Roseateles amylovorans]|uniref:Type III secretion system effector protein n=1 Tax=Roseateles amylovorans TaxID=2978473 RepID=A0ABY6B0B3_9BURK|nr:hypothetical protein [Roseateles amylovorans]UXH78270.1 hypothetical protein N4261_25535 [Roseateles amylovorans]
MTKSPTLNTGASSAAIPLTTIQPSTNTPTGTGSSSTPSLPRSPQHRGPPTSVELQGLSRRTSSSSGSPSPRQSLNEVLQRTPPAAGGSVSSQAAQQQPEVLQREPTPPLSRRASNETDGPPTPVRDHIIEIERDPPSNGLVRSSSTRSAPSPTGGLPPHGDYIALASPTQSGGAEAAALTLGQGVAQAREQLRASGNAQGGVAPAGPEPHPEPQPEPEPAGRVAFFAAQNARHAIPVAGVRTVVQGVLAPEMARLLVSNPNVALGLQVGLTALSLVRRIASQMHSESASTVANRAFAGEEAGENSSTARRLWQGAQTVGILAGDAAALSLSVMARSHPQLQSVAQSVAAIQVIAHLQSQFREMLRPAINTVHVGNQKGNVAQPPEGRNLRAADIPLSMRAQFGVAAAGIDFTGQLIQQFALGGQPAWNSPRGMAVLAGAIAGVANMLTSSVEDHMVDQASARRMQETHHSHVAHLHNDFRNPFTRDELGRQAERVDTRVFNTMVPALMALGVMQAIQTQTPPNANGSRPADQIATQATVHAVCAGLVLGSLLALTVKSYQLNDDVRKHKSNERKAAANPAAP